MIELIFVHQLDGRLLDHLRRHLELVDRHDLAVNLDFGWCKRCKEKVRGLLLDHQFEKRFDVHVCKSVAGLESLAVSSSMMRRLSDC